MLRIISGLLALVISSAAFGQAAVLQGGGWTPGRAPMYVGQGGSQPIVQDSGPAGGGSTGLGLSELLLTARGTGTPPFVAQGSGPLGTNSCNYDAPINNATGYHYLCMSPNAQGGGLIAYGSGGTASQLPFNFNINGTSYQFPFSVGGIIGPNTSVVGDLAVWNNAIGTLLKDVPFATLCGSNVFTSIAAGCVPASGGGTTNFLRADGTFASPGAVSSIVVGTTNITGGAVSHVLFDNGTLGEYGISGTGSVAMTAGPTFTGILTAATISPTTINAFSLGGTLSGGGNQINNVIIGNTTPLAGSFTNLLASGTSIFGKNATLPGGGATFVAVNGNTWNAITAMAGFGPQLVVVGPDGNRGAMALQSYMQSTAGNESSYLAFTSRGTMQTPASIQIGDSVGEFFAHGATTTGGFQFLHNAGAGFTMTATDNFLVGAAGEQINVFTTPTGTGTAALAGTIYASGGWGIGSAADPGINALSVGTLISGGGSFSTPGVTVGTAGYGLLQPGANQIAIAVNGGSVLDYGVSAATTLTFGANTVVVGSIKSNFGTGGIGYATGTGGAVTQTSSRTTTTPAINKVTGQITLVSAPGSATPFSFTVANTTIAATDTVQVVQLSGTDRYQVNVTKITASTGFDLTITDLTGTTTEQPVFNFTILKGVNS